MLSGPCNVPGIPGNKLPGMVAVKIVYIRSQLWQNDACPDGRFCMLKVI